mmetsp:Transcript_12327/g.29621  ORF Transcript_12327/g.29621 Transcript_12327/m.29621 type:complete len:97 (-) Transcript_12327:259-549(-)
MQTKRQPTSQVKTKKYVKMVTELSVDPLHILSTESYVAFAFAFSLSHTHSFDSINTNLFFSLIISILTLLVFGIVIPATTDYGDGVCNPLLTGGRC